MSNLYKAVSINEKNVENSNLSYLYCYSHSDSFINYSSSERNGVYVKSLFIF